MSRILPPRPDLAQLKHQAKDLLRAHKRKDRAASATLKLLRQFASSSDAAILDKPLALHEAQYALAMDYGFASWNALKRHVEKISSRPDRVRHEKDRTYVAGLEKHGIGCKDEHDSSIIACLAGVMDALGEDFSYPYLLGVSGAAFRVQMHYPAWCPSAACAPCGYDCVPGAMAATGYRLRCIDTQREGKCLPEGVQAASQAVHESIDRGAPAILVGKEAGLIVGYGSDGKLMVRPYDGGDSDGYHDAELFGSAGALPEALAKVIDANGWVWGVGIVEPAELPMDRKQAVANSLRLAVTLAKTERFGNYLSGFAALERWSEDLLDDSLFASLTPGNWFQMAHGNGYCYPCLWSSRLNAEKYLREVASCYDAPLEAKFLELAGLYRQIHQALLRTKPEFDCIWSLMPWILKSPENWTRSIREKEASLLREVAAIERQAVAKIESLLELLEP